MSLLAACRLLVVTALLLVAVPGAALGKTSVIEPGREQEVLALFAPHALQAEVADGFRLMNVAIRPVEIVVELRHADGTSAHIRLVNAADVDAAERSASFSVLRDERATTGDARFAADRLVRALVHNDRGDFWRVEVAGDPRPGPAGQRERELPRGLSLGIPLGIAALTMAGMLLMARRKQRREEGG